LIAVADQLYWVRELSERLEFLQEFLSVFFGVPAKTLAKMLIAEPTLDIDQMLSWPVTIRIGSPEG
jgi:hypothetical protein